MREDGALNQGMELIRCNVPHVAWISGLGRALLVRKRETGVYDEHDRRHTLTVAFPH